MATFSIIYHTFDPHSPESEKKLGTEVVENIDEVLVPLNDKNTAIFITKIFSGVSCKRWKVEFVLGISETTWGVWLTEKNVSDDVYLSQTMSKRNINHPGGILKRGSIVIVEFGQIYQALHFHNGLSDTRLYPCHLQNGEMHKRRPAIVTGADKRGVKVVPITSQEPHSWESNRAIFELESASLQHISEFRPGKRSFALCEMIQTVSATRILPPYARDMKGAERRFRRDESYYRKISSNDMKALDDGLLTAVGLQRLRKRMDSLINERELIQINERTSQCRIESLFLANQQISAELALTKERYHVLSQLHLNTSEHDCLDQIDDEVSEYLGHT